MPDDEGVLDEWLADVEALQRRLDPDHLYSIVPDAIRPHASALQRMVAAVRRARARQIPSLVLEEVVYLARAVEDARIAEVHLILSQVSQQLGDAEAAHALLDRALYQADVADDARLRGLGDSRKRRQTELQAKLEALRPEFERRVRNGMSASRAAQILGERYGLNPDTIRKRLRKFPA